MPGTTKLIWARREPFNPISREQLLVYCGYKGYPVPKNRKTKKPTLDDEALEKLSLRYPEDPILSGVRGARAISKAKGYLKGTYLGRDDRLHPQYINLPETGRLSSKSPNIMNQPQGRDAAKAELAREVRNTVIATPGFRLGETDWRAIEALLVGFFGDDPGYMRLARLGVHDFLTCHVIIKQPPQWAITKELGNYPMPEDFPLVEDYQQAVREYEERAAILGPVVEWFKKEPPSLEMADDLLKVYFGKVKKLFPKARYSCKTVVHGSNYLAGIPTIARNLECSYQEAETLVAIYRDSLPGIKSYQQKTLAMAHKERHLICPFGCDSPYWFNVGEPDGDGWRMGKQANEAAAWRPQHTCSCLLREVLVLLDEMDGDDFHLLAPIHDSIFWEAREERYDYYRERVKEVMERRWPELGGLGVETETKGGLRWSEMA